MGGDSSLEEQELKNASTNKINIQRTWKRMACFT